MTTFYKHIHFHDDPRTPAVSFMAQTVGDSTTDIRLAWAVCSRDDNFCRKTGREVAQMNMTNGRFVTGTLDDKSVPLRESLIAILMLGENLREEDRHYQQQALDAINKVEEEQSWLESYMGSITDFIREYRSTPVGIQKRVNDSTESAKQKLGSVRSSVTSMYDRFVNRS